MAELTLREAARKVGVSRQTVYRMVKEGKLSVTVRPDPASSSNGKGKKGYIKVVDTAELLRAFGSLERRVTATETVPRQPPLQSTGLPETTPATARPGLQAMTAEDRRREVEIADREALRAELAAARDALRRAEEQIQEAREREAKLLELAQSATRLLEHREAAAAPPPRGFWRRMFGG